MSEAIIQVMHCGDIITNEINLLVEAREQDHGLEIESTRR